MFNPTDHIIHVSDGRLGSGSSTSREDVRRIVAQALASDAKSGIVVHFHGGLVSEKAARKSAQEALYPLYAERAKAYPLFFIWEAGFFEAPLNNLREIAKEDLFQEFVKKAAEWVLKKLPGQVGFKGAGGASLNEADLRDEFDAFFEGRRATPPDQLEPLPGIDDALLAAKTKGASVNEEDLVADIEASIAGDTDFQDGVQSARNGLHVAVPLDPVTRGGGTSASASSLISKEAASRLFQQGPTTKGLGPVSWMAVARAVAAVVLRVIRRMRAGRAHGLYVTLVEETLRELYIDKIGRHGWWDRMKLDMADAFKAGDAYAGTAFLTELAQQLEGIAAAPKITLVGHSAGAIYICNLLKAAADRAPNLQFDVIFEAPAATHALLAATAAEHGSRIRNFRQFGMSNERETTDNLVPVLYLSSLLYFVSGLLEGEPDEPLVGMERYLKESAVYNADAFPNIEACRQFYARYPNGLVWSPSTSGNGLNSDGMKHGEFDDVDPATLESVCHILQHGF